jgi:hypothetical protein
MSRDTSIILPKAPTLGAGSGYIAQLIGLIEKTNFVFNNFVVNVKHEGYHLVSIDLRFCHLQPKPATLCFSRKLSDFS